MSPPDSSPACGRLEPPPPEEALVVRLGTLARTLGAVEWVCAGTHFVAAALACVLVEGVMRTAGLGLSFTHTLTRVLVQLTFRPAACRPEILSTHTPTRLLVQLFVGTAEVLLQWVFKDKKEEQSQRSHGVMNMNKNF